MTSSTAQRPLFPVPSVFQVDLGRIVALENMKLLPALPQRVERMNVHDVDRVAPAESIAPLEWFVAGDPFKPSAMMATRFRFDYHYNTEVIEVVHVAGSRRGVDRLIRQARFMAAMYGVPLTGEIDFANATMRRFLRRCGFRLERVRFTLSGDALLEGLNRK